MSTKRVAKKSPADERFGAYDPAWEAPRRAAFEVAKDELAITARITTSAYPLQIVGTVDGRSFYLRERHGEYALHLAGESKPMVFVKQDFSFEGSSVILDGGEDDLYGEGDDYFAQPLSIAVAAIRIHLGTQQ